MNNECTRKSECIRYEMYENSSAENREILVVNPKCVSDTATCPYFAKLGIARVAYGFSSTLDSLPRKTAKKIAETLISHFGRNPYYERRKGERPISPDEQQYILSVLTEQGITLPSFFERYDEQEEWVQK